MFDSYEFSDEHFLTIEVQQKSRADFVDSDIVCTKWLWGAMNSIEHVENQPFSSYLTIYVT